MIKIVIRNALILSHLAIATGVFMYFGTAIGLMSMGTLAALEAICYAVAVGNEKGKSIEQLERQLERSEERLEIARKGNEILRKQLKKSEPIGRSANITASINERRKAMGLPTREDPCNHEITVDELIKPIACHQEIWWDPRDEPGF